MKKINENWRWDNQPLGILLYSTTTPANNNNNVYHPAANFHGLGLWSFFSWLKDVFYL
jgi:hypothetical protein